MAGVPYNRNLTAVSFALTLSVVLYEYINEFHMSLKLIFLLD